jgi:hypothetical protein
MAVHSVQKSDPIAHRARHDVLAFDERPNEPILVPDQAKSVGKVRKLLDHFDLGVFRQFRDDVAGLEATRKIKHPARCTISIVEFDVLRNHAQHLIIEPRVEHGFAKAPLISDLHARQRALGYKLDDRPLVHVQVSGDLASRH